MKKNNNEIYLYITQQLSINSIRYITHNFLSGAIMIDVWHNNFFYIIQIDENFVGFSKINETNPGFDCIPDELIYNQEQLIEKLELIFNL